MSNPQPQTKELAPRCRAVHQAAAGLLAREDAAQASEQGAPTRPVLNRGRGGLVIDLDGRELIDLWCGGGACLLGHADERLVAAVTKSAAKGYALGSPTEAQVRLAELLIARFGFPELIRFTASRTAAIADAVRIARRHTGRTNVAVVEGTCPWVIRESLGIAAEVPARKVQSGARAVTEPDPHVLTGFDADSAAKWFDVHGSELAAIVLEPVPTALGVLPPAESWLVRLRALCDQYGAMLIFDEGRTGLRVPGAGAGGRMGVTPDLICLGNQLAGGLPLGAIGGRREVMSLFRGCCGAVCADDGGLEPSISAAATVMQVTAEPDFYESLEALATQLEAGLRTAAEAANQGSGRKVAVNRYESLVSVFFHDGPVAQVAEARAADAKDYQRWAVAAEGHGVMVPFPPDVCLSVCAAHRAEQIEQAVDVFTGAFRDL